MSFGSLVINPPDLVEIMDRLKQKGWNSPFKLVDLGDQYAIRDVNEALITFVNKQPLPESEP